MPGFDSPADAHPSLEFTQPVAQVHAKLLDPDDTRKMLYDAFYAVNAKGAVASRDLPIGGKQPVWPQVAKRRNFHLQLELFPPGASSAEALKTHAEFFADAKATPGPETLAWTAPVSRPDVVDFLPFRPIELLPPEMQ